MENTFQNAINNRRSYYSLSNETTMADGQLQELLKAVIWNTPSAFNSQSSRMILLLREHHEALWEITKEALRTVVAESSFHQTEYKINSCFKAAYGTILFYEDVEVIDTLQQKYPNYADRFVTWSEQTSAMHQFSTWILLEESGLGASLQHYNPLIDKLVERKWGINPKWKLIAQMPFGKPIAEPNEKTHDPIEKRLIVI